MQNRLTGSGDTMSSCFIPKIHVLHDHLNENRLKSDFRKMFYMIMFMKIDSKVISATRNFPHYLLHLECCYDDRILNYHDFESLRR